jgi:hypothetical protein
VKQLSVVCLVFVNQRLHMTTKIISGVSFRWDIPIVLYRIIKYNQNVVRHNSINDFIKMYSDIVTTCFGSSYGPSSCWILFLNKVKYTISNAVAIVAYKISYHIKIWRKIDSTVYSIKINLVEVKYYYTVYRISKLQDIIIMECGVGTRN